MAMVKPDERPDVFPRGRSHLAYRTIGPRPRRGRSADPCRTHPRGKDLDQDLAERVHVSRANASCAGGTGCFLATVSFGFTAQIDPERPAWARAPTSCSPSSRTRGARWRRRWRPCRTSNTSLSSGGDFDVLRWFARRTTRSCGMWSSSASRMPGVRGTRTWLVFDEHKGRVGWALTASTGPPGRGPRRGGGQAANCRSRAA